MYLLLALLLVPSTTAFIGFDCGGQNLNVTSVSLLTVGDCDLNFKFINSTPTHIQLLQLSNYNYAEVIQCKVEVTRTIYYCGMHSHVSIVQNGQAGYLEEIPFERCQRMHRDGTITLGQNGLINGLKRNQTTTTGVTLAGRIKNDGSCSGTQYNDPYGAWDNVIVQAMVRISLRSSYVPVHLTSGKIFLKSGTTCELSEGFCIDTDHGYTFWKPMPTTACDFHQYDILYEGPATKMQDDSMGSHPITVYSLTTQDITFALTTTSEQQMCGYTLLRTEHPKLFILQSRDNIKPRENIPVDNLDIFTYVNSKFVYVEKHIRTQMTALYHDVIQQRCELEVEVLRNTLSFATLLPDEFAYRLMKKPGYMAVTAGEAIHIIKCIPVDVTVRRTRECYIELPVSLHNSSLFLTPKSRILTKYGTQKDCSYELPTLYNIENTWVQFTPEPHVRQLPPQQLRPMTKVLWKYLTPGPLASSGIYSKQDIEKLRDHIMFPAEKPALLHSVARGITGHTTGSNTVSMYNLLDEEALQKIAHNTATRLWGGFITFGSATAGVLGIFIIIRIIKIIIDTAIHGYALHMAYGCSLHLLGAIWSSLTHLLLHLARGPLKRNNPSNKPDGNKEQDLRAPSTAPTETTINNHHIVEIQPQSPGSCEYKELSQRLHMLEQIPLKSTELCSKTGGEM